MSKQNYIRYEYNFYLQQLLSSLLTCLKRLKWAPSFIWFCKSIPTVSVVVIERVLWVNSKGLIIFLIKSDEWRSLLKPGSTTDLHEWMRKFNSIFDLEHAFSKQLSAMSSSARARENLKYFCFSKFQILNFLKKVRKRKVKKLL